MASMFPTSVVTPTGITTGAAYADKDAIGTTAMEFTVPQTGIIETANYYDLDDEGLQVDLWLFTAAPAAQTDNSAFTLTDAELQTCVGVIEFTSFADATNGQFSQRKGLGLGYYSNGGTLYGQLQARGALNIASSNLPGFRLLVIP